MATTNSNELKGIGSETGSSARDEGVVVKKAEEKAGSQVEKRRKKASNVPGMMRSLTVRSPLLPPFLLSPTLQCIIARP